MRCESDHFVTTPYYHLSDDAYQQLVNTRDQLFLLARLAAGRSRHDDLPGNELQIAAAPLSQCFQQLAEAMQGCLQGASCQVQDKILG